jgi:hypothetical protein
MARKRLDALRKQLPQSPRTGAACLAPRPRVRPPREGRKTPQIFAWNVREHIFLLANKSFGYKISIERCK